MNIASTSHLGFALQEININLHNPSLLQFSLMATQNSTTISSLVSNNSTHSDTFVFDDSSSAKIILNYTQLDGTNHNAVFQYTIDGSVGTLPALALSGAAVESGGATVASPTAYLSLSNLTDDPGGVGYSGAQCRNGTSPWSDVTGASFSIPSPARRGDPVLHRVQDSRPPGERRRVQLVQRDGGRAPPAVDSVAPVPSSTIAPNSTLAVSLSDSSGMGTSTLSWQWTDGSSTSWANETVSSGSWSGSASTLFGPVGDGTVNLAISAYDALGNLRQSTGHAWVLNTTLPLATLSLTGAHVGSFLPSSGATINLHPPGAAGYASWISWSVEHGGSTVASGNDTATASAPISGLSDGPLWVNLTVGDEFGRSNGQSWQFTIDGSVGTLPALALSGAAVESGGATVASPTAYLSLSNLTDDPGGVGYSGAQCRNGTSPWSDVTGASFSIPSQPDAETQFSIECRIADLLGNVGGSSWETQSNGTVDALPVAPRSTPSPPCPPPR